MDLSPYLLQTKTFTAVWTVTPVIVSPTLNTTALVDVAVIVSTCVANTAELIPGAEVVKDWRKIGLVDSIVALGKLNHVKSCKSLVQQPFRRKAKHRRHICAINAGEGGGAKYANAFFFAFLAIWHLCGCIFSLHFYNFLSFSWRKSCILCVEKKRCKQRRREQFWTILNGPVFFCLGPPFSLVSCIFFAFFFALFAFAFSVLPICVFSAPTPSNGNWISHTYKSKNGGKKYCTTAVK